MTSQSPNPGPSPGSSPGPGSGRDSGPGPLPAVAGAPDSHQARFERRWGHLLLPQVRALAWLLDAPDLLDGEAPPWQGRIATLGPISPRTAAWLAALDRDPAPLDAALGARHTARLGLYAEKLLAFYFAEHGVLVAHGLQVRASRDDTVGEFDFLLREGDELVHIELATKFYLLDAAAGQAAGLHGLVGPNLADTLGAKMRKIFEKQLSLSRHPAAQALLPQAVARALALVKGWLFYPAGHAPPPPMAGIAAAHCRGDWMTLGQARMRDGGDADGDGGGLRHLVMPRLRWLAPLKTRPGQGDMDRQALHLALEQELARTDAPVMVAALREEDGWLVEQRRGFVVPDDWPERAARRRGDGGPPAPVTAP